MSFNSGGAPQCQIISIIFSFSIIFRPFSENIDANIIGLNILLIISVTSSSLYLAHPYK